MLIDRNLCSICDEAHNQHIDYFNPNNLYPIHTNNNNSSSRNNDPNNNFNTKISSATEKTNLQNASSFNFSNNPLKLNSKNSNDNEDYTINRLLINKNNIGEANLLPDISDNSDKYANDYFKNKGKKKEFSLPKEIITELENPNLCVICFDSDTSRHPAVKFQCNHIFCLECVKNYLEKNIENGKVNIILIRFLT